jgi:dephospho-CoA kinase
MLLVGLTGGIGAGKSTVARMLADRGAVILDADAFAREAIGPGTPGAGRVAARFGDGVIRPDGTVDRASLAALVFADDAARADLEAIVHPEVRRRIAEGIAAESGTDHVVVVDSPLLIETGAHRDMPIVIVVSAAPGTQVARLVTRGMSERDARARIGAQLPIEDKVAAADVILDNEGTEAELETQVDRLWGDLAARAAAG